jgi:hypothetical protein
LFNHFDLNKENMIDWRDLCIELSGEPKLEGDRFEITRRAY